MMSDEVRNISEIWGGNLRYFSMTFILKTIFRHTTHTTCLEKFTYIFFSQSSWLDEMTQMQMSLVFIIESGFIITLIIHTIRTQMFVSCNVVCC